MQVRTINMEPGPVHIDYDISGTHMGAFDLASQRSGGYQSYPMGSGFLKVNESAGVALTLVGKEVYTFVVLSDSVVFPIVDTFNVSHEDQSSNVCHFS